MTPPTGRDSDKFMLRLPEGMREQLKKLAAENSRSLNAEIVHRLSMSLDVDTWDEVPLSGDETAAVEKLLGFLDRARDQAAKLKKG